MTAFIWETVWFENLYYEGAGLTSLEQVEISQIYQQKHPLVQSAPILNISDAYSIDLSYNYYSYSTLFGIIDRFTDFFAPESKMRQIKNNF